MYTRSAARAVLSKARSTTKRLRLKHRLRKPLRNTPCTVLDEKYELFRRSDKSSREKREKEEK